MMNYYNFTNLISKLKANKNIEYVQMQSKSNPNYLVIYVIVVQSSMNRVYLKFIPKNSSFNIAIYKIFLDDVFQFRSDKDYSDSDIDFLFVDIDKTISNLMINESVVLCSRQGNTDYEKMISEHIRIIEFELAKKRI